MPEISEILATLARVRLPPGEVIPKGASQDQIERFQRESGLLLPGEFRRWLQATNGPCAGPGGIVGVETKRKGQDLGVILRNFPKWKQQGWLPVAGDGCGNYYVLVTAHPSGKHPVGFVDAIERNDAIAYIVASSLSAFLLFLLRRETGEKRWPFDQDFVKQNDPGILEFRDVPLPWTERAT